MIRPYDDTNDIRLHDIAWLKEHINEFNDSDKILDLRETKQKKALTKAFESAPTEDELDAFEKAETEAAKIAFEHALKGDN